MIRPVRTYIHTMYTVWTYKFMLTPGHLKNDPAAMTSSCIAPHLCSQRQHHKSCTHIFGGIGWGFYSRASRVSNQLKEIMRVSNNRRCTHFLSLFSLVVCRGIELANAWSARPFPTGKSQLRSVQKEYQRRREFCNLPDTCRCMMLQDSDSEKADSEKVDIEPRNNDDVPPRSQYSLGIGKNMPLKQRSTDAKERDGKFDAAQNWIAPQPVRKPQQPAFHYEVRTANVPSTDGSRKNDRETYSVVKKRKMVARDQESQQLRSALWHEEHFRSEQPLQGCQPSSPTGTVPITTSIGVDAPRKFFEDIDMSIPSTVYNDTYDAVWELLRFEAYKEAQREPLLVSFLHSTILNHRSMESSLAFLLANQLSSPMMISTQLQSFILEALNSSPDFRRAVRADMLAVRDRDPACTCLPDVFLYFKGFQALQSHRVAHCMWNSGKTVLAHYLQSQVSQMFQIDIHPNATMGEGIMLDHGTG